MNDLQTVNTLKGLVIDAVHKAKSGHPGGAMSSMDYAYLLFTEYLKFDPSNTKWLGRDRFILSAGHESMLAYSLLHYIGWLEMDDLKLFRQMKSRTPGHPENFMTPGIECTTGPLGQGAAMSVGFAIASRHQEAALDQNLFRHKTYVLLGDGCMQEDITLGAASLAGHLKLDQLVWYYDQNHVQIAGTIDRVASDDYKKVFEGMQWEVLEVNAHDHAALRKVLDHAQTKRNRPLLIIGDSKMANGAFSMEGSNETHGSPLPAEERLKTRAKLGLPADQDFHVPPESYKHFRRNFDKRRAEADAWQKDFDLKSKDAAFKAKFAAFYETSSYPDLPQVTWPIGKPVATRNAFGDIIELWADHIPNFIGGSADLDGSNMTEQFVEKVGDFQADSPLNRNLAFGVREFPMSAISNGLALHGGMIPFDATFLAFADYSRAALRLGAIQRCRVIHEFSHDSFFLGEDGPTHQPVEQVMSLRLIPNFYVMRPADAHETQVMMDVAINLTESPSAICLTRQKLPLLHLDLKTISQARFGAYAVLDCDAPEVVILATGSEVSLALTAAQALSKLKIKVVSMPCWELFLEQPKSYQDAVLSPKCLKRVSIEAGTTTGWQKFTGMNGLNIGLDHFGDSGPAEDLAREYGFTPDQVVASIKKYLEE
ncbi:MAG: transketolase [Chitinophagaceae bacterium]|nr:transketolase [Oligoflexus sp.]